MRRPITPGRLPLLLLHGAEDRTADPEGSRALMHGAFSCDKTLKMYPGRRQDLLNEPGHEQVMGDIISWLAAHE
jgi:acylglycerol lipase